jgi:hypothetical protein
MISTTRSTPWMISPKLEADWDGMSSVKPDAGCLSAARRFIARIKDNPERCLTAPMRVLPSPQGTICFEWFYGDTRHEAEFLDEQTIEWMMTSPGSVARHWKDIIP